MSFRRRFKLSESGDDGDGDGDGDGNRAAYIRKPKASFWEQGERHSNHSSSFQCHSNVVSNCRKVMEMEMEMEMMEMMETELPI